MAKTTLRYVEAVLVIVAVAVPVHYFGGVEWPWAVVAGSAAAIVLRRLIHRTPEARL